MHRLPRWAVVLFALVGPVGPVGASPSDEARRMPVGPPDASTPSAVIPAPAAPPPPAPVVMPGPAVAPQYAAPTAPVAPPAQAQQPVATGTGAGQAPAKGAQNNGHRWRLFHRRSGDEAPQSAKSGLFKRR
jgi:hypothetical protein